MLSLAIIWLQVFFELPQLSHITATDCSLIAPIVERDLRSLLREIFPVRPPYIDVTANSTYQSPTLVRLDVRIILDLSAHAEANALDSALLICHGIKEAVAAISMQDMIDFHLTIRPVGAEEYRKIAALLIDTAGLDFDQSY